MLQHLKMFVLVATLNCVGCATIGNDASSPKERYSTADHLEKLNGVWVSDGYGYAIKQTDDTFAFYHVTPEVCVAADVRDELLADVFERFRFSNRRQTVHFSSLTEPHEFLFNKVSTLPSSCKREPDSSRMRTIDALISFMQQHYVFFEERNVNWADATR